MLGLIHRTAIGNARRAREEVSAWIGSGIQHATRLLQATEEGERLPDAPTRLLEESGKGGLPRMVNSIFVEGGSDKTPAATRNGRTERARHE